MFGFEKWIYRNSYKQNSSVSKTEKEINEIEVKKNDDINFNELKEKYNFSNEFLQILKNRISLSEKEVLNFLFPRLKNLYKPCLLPNIDLAVKRIKKAYLNKQKIIIYGDYDTDGIISTAILYNFLQLSGFNVDYYIPNRFEDGYDINLNFIKNVAIKNGYSLIICVDCGTNAIEVINFLKEISLKKFFIDVIVCDHHEPLTVINNIFESKFDKKEKLASEDFNNSSDSIVNYLIINPKLSISKYPFKFLCGAGVTFKLIVQLLNNFDANIKHNFFTNLENEKNIAHIGFKIDDKNINDLSNNYLKSIIDLVAIATVADLMPLIDENRIIVSYGLRRIAHTKNPGLKKLIDKLFNNKISFNTYDVGFIIAPRLNASGRIKHGIESLKLLINDSRQNYNLEDILDNIENYNSSRQQIQELLYNEILEDRIKRLDYNLNECKILIDSSPDWNEGILGIVASKLVKKMNIPVILFKEKEGTLKGSARSIEDFNLYSALNNFKDYFIKFGGHSQACGLTILKEEFEKFKNDMLSYTKSSLTKDDITKKYFYDIEIDFNKINRNLVLELEKLEPFGIGNPKPVFYTKSCEIISEPVIINSNKENIKYVFLKLKNNKKIFDAAFFNFSTDLKKVTILNSDFNSLNSEINFDSFDKYEEYQNILKKGMKIDILYNLERKYQSKNSKLDNEKLLNQKEITQIKNQIKNNDFIIQLLIVSFLPSKNSF